MSDGGYQSHEFTLARPTTATAGPSPTDQTLKPGAESVPDAEPIAISQQVANLVEQLPLDEREAMTLYFFEKWPLERVAATMDRSSEQVAALLLSASKTLKTQLGPT